MRKTRKVQLKMYAGLTVLLVACFSLTSTAKTAKTAQAARHKHRRHHHRKTRRHIVKAKKENPAFKVVLPRHESAEQKKEHLEQLEAVSMLKDDQRKFPRLQMLGDSNLEFVFVLHPRKSKGSDRVINTAEVKAEKINLEKLQVKATENFFKKLVSAGGTGIEVKKTEFGDEIRAMSIDPKILDPRYTLSLLTFPPVFEGIQGDLGMKTLLIAPVLEKEILVAEDTPANRLALQHAIDKLHLEDRDKRDWASSKVYQFTGKDFTAL